jgi:hypothetical protein
MFTQPLWRLSTRLVLYISCGSWVCVGPIDRKTPTYSYSQNWGKLQFTPTHKTEENFNLLLLTKLRKASIYSYSQNWGKLQLTPTHKTEESFNLLLLTKLRKAPNAYKSLHIVVPVCFPCVTFSLVLFSSLPSSDLPAWPWACLKFSSLVTLPWIINLCLTLSLPEV